MCAGSSASRARPATRSSTATRMMGWRRSRDRSRRPVRYANQLPDQIERTIVAAKKDKPHWGARKIRELLVRKLAGDVRIPAKSTVHAVLDRHGLVKHARQRRRFKAEGTPLSQAAAPNDLWCADFKGEFRLGNGQYCYPLTVTDQASRISCCAKRLNRRKEAARHRGLRPPLSGNAACRRNKERQRAALRLAPTASTISPGSRSCGCRLGIAIERIKPGNPQQNGRHERMHRTLKAGDDPAAGAEQPAAAGQVRCFRQRIQCRDGRMRRST